MTTYATLRDLPGGVSQKVEAAMFPGEEFLGAIDTYHLLRIISTELLILTDQRVILYKKGLIRQSTKDYDLDRISNVSFDKGIIFRKLKVSGSAFSSTWALPYNGGQAFANAIRAPEPQPVYGSSGGGASVAGEQRKSQPPTDGEGSARQTQSAGQTGDGLDTAYIFDQDAEQFGFDKWHYVAGGAALLGVVGIGANISEIGPLFLLVAGVAMYIDILQIRASSTWDPRAWLYEIGVIFLFIGVFVYLFNRYRVQSNSVPDDATDDDTDLGGGLQGEPAAEKE